MVNHVNVSFNVSLISCISLKRSSHSIILWVKILSYHYQTVHKILPQSTVIEFGVCLFSVCRPFNPIVHNRVIISQYVSVIGLQLSSLHLSHIHLELLPAAALIHCISDLLVSRALLISKDCAAIYLV